MSLKTVTMRRLGCDEQGCEAETEVTNSDGIAARFEAALNGWSYAAHPVQGSRGRSRRFDYCPEHGADEGESDA